MNTRVRLAVSAAGALLLVSLAAHAEPGPTATTSRETSEAVVPTPPSEPAVTPSAIVAPADGVAGTPSAPQVPSSSAAAPAAVASAPAPVDTPATFGAPDSFPPPPDQSVLGLKMYGDTLFQVRNHASVHNTFAAPHLDLFGTADVDRLSFLTEVFFEADDNQIATDLERLQVSYLFSNWLRLRMGRTHTAFGYYNDTYHHGNLFELTTARPYAVEFEDGGGLFVAHLVGIGADGVFDLSSAGQLHYDLEVGNGRLADTTMVAIEEAGKDAKLINLRLRWLPIDGLIIGGNILHDQIPGLAPVAGAVGRPRSTSSLLARTPCTWTRESMPYSKCMPFDTAFPAVPSVSPMAGFSSSAMPLVSSLRISGPSSFGSREVVTSSTKVTAERTSARGISSITGSGSIGSPSRSWR